MYICTLYLCLWYACTDSMHAVCVSSIIVFAVYLREFSMTVHAYPCVFSTHWSYVYIRTYMWCKLVYLLLTSIFFV